MSYVIRCVASSIDGKRAGENFLKQKTPWEIYTPNKKHALVFDTVDKASAAKKKDYTNRDFSYKFTIEPA